MSNTPVPSTSADLAFLEAVTKAENDPLTRFLDALSPPARREVDEILRLRTSFLHHVQVVLAGDARDVMLSAGWLREHAPEVAAKWSWLRRELARHATRDLSAPWGGGGRHIPNAAPFRGITRLGGSTGLAPALCVESTASPANRPPPRARPRGCSRRPPR